MSNIIPPMVSSSPPPMDDTVEEDEDDEFGDFAAAEDLDAPPTPSKLPVISSSFWEEDCQTKHNGICNGTTTDEDEEEGDRKEVERVVVGQDNTSQDSVVSGATDSGLCSASQNSDGASLSPVAGSSPSPVGPDREESSESDETLVRSVDTDVRVCSDIQTDTIAEEGVTSSDDFDNFSDFQSVNEVRTECESDEVSKHLSEEVDEFGDFESVPVVAATAPAIATTTTAAIATTTTAAAAATVEEEDIDFEDFESAEVHCSIPLDKSELVQRLQVVVTSLFPLSTTGDLFDLDVPPLDDSLKSLWLKLKDLESSHALSYQWSGSAANKSLLSALGIDSRNILFGARWNTSVPRFAANLGFSPLEPVRASRSSPSASTSAVTAATTITSAAASTTATTAPAEQEAVVPAAQFDWNSSGLVNPLDSSSETPSDHALVQGILEMPTPEMSSGSELVQRILASSQSTPAPRSRQGLSAEAVQVLDELPDLSFLQAKLLMFPVRGTSP